MEWLAITIYEYFERRKLVFWITFVALIGVMAAGASRIKIEEDITKFLPNDKKSAGLNYFFQNSKFTEQIVVMVSVRDSATVPDPDSLVMRADAVIDSLGSLKQFIRKISGRVDDEKMLRLMQVFQENLPVFLTDEDYAHLDSLLQPETLEKTLRQNYDRLISPGGIMLKKIIAQDPLGFSFMPLNKLREIQFDSNFKLYDGFIVTKDNRHLIFFVTPAIHSMETGVNGKFVARLNSLFKDVSGNSGIIVSGFGGPIVAVGNSVQLSKDTVLTVSLTVIFLAVFLIGFFRRKRVPFLIFIPVAFGGVFSLFCIWLIKDSVSILALAAGSVVLGIAVNYALHFLSHLRHTGDIRKVLKDLAKPMTIGSATTVFAFFCLQFTNAAVLRDLGLFAGFSLVGAATCSMIFLPHLVSPVLFSGHHVQENFLDRIPFTKWASKKGVVWFILLATPVFYYFAGRVNFDSDMSKLNYMSDETRISKERLEKINPAAQSTIFIMSREPTLEAALRKNEQAMPRLAALKASGEIHRYSSVSSFLISDSLQVLRLAKWKHFWTSEKKAMAKARVADEARLLKFSESVIRNFDTLISKQYLPIAAQTRQLIRTSLFDDYIIQKDTTSSVVTMIGVDATKKNDVYSKLIGISAQVFDRQMLTNMFVGYVNADFNFIVMFTAILVFVSLLISYGRIELTMMTFVPMFITWIWILGIMAIAGISFNIVNVMVSTFIFGLGDDYSIFIMDGLQQEYTTGRKNLPSIRTSIFLSAVTTVTGLGVLFFAQHPAMRSIAAISIIGILCVFVMSQTIEPWLFRILITRRTEKHLPPMTFTGTLGTSITYGTFLTGSLVMPFVGLVVRIMPFGRKKLMTAFHWMLRWIAHFIIYVEIGIRKKIIGRTSSAFQRPAVIIANHSSVIDILLTVMLGTKLILITNKWVRNSPILGGVARLADYHTMTDNIDEGLEAIRKRVDEGYSVVIFPEGTRSETTAIQRFHKGAFYLAEKLSLPIRPLLIHGAGYISPKGCFYLPPGQFTLKFLPLIEVSDDAYGAGYSERTKSISRYFKKEYAMLAREIETPRYFARRLISGYIYKGPVLEWYLRVKLRLEKNYEQYYNLLPRTGKILDLGCGYGFLCHLLHLREPNQEITGVDHDNLKIETASQSFLRTGSLRFEECDVTTWPLESYSGIVLSDILHYINSEEQDVLIARCFQALTPGGIMIIRDGNASQNKQHGRTKFSELVSIKIIKFNKSNNELEFIDAAKIVQRAHDAGLNATIEGHSRLTSNVFIVIRKPEAGR